MNIPDEAVEAAAHRYECVREGCGFTCNTVIEIRDHVDFRAIDAGERDHRMRDARLARKLK